MKTLLATAALVVAIASPALAQSYDPDVGTGNLDGAPYASNDSAVIHVDRSHPTHVLTTPSEAYAHVPNAALAPAPGNGYRWPLYDAEGVDQNAPGE